jgi:hypothetical protein
MNARFTISAVLCLTIALVLMHAERTLASSTLVGNSTGIHSLQKDAGSDSATVPVTPSANSLYRDVPSLSGRYSAGGMTLLPYIGAGFGAGYSSELNRAFAPNPEPQQNLNLGGPLGQKMVPNEFQMGIRIPF